MRYFIMLLVFVVLLFSSCSVKEVKNVDDNLKLSSDVKVIDNSEKVVKVNMDMEPSVKSRIISISELNSKRFECRSDKDCYNFMVTLDVSNFYNYECVTDRMSDGKGICNFY